MPDNSSTIFDTISDATRRAILRLMLDRLAADEHTTSPADVVTALGVSRQSANRHLGVLAEAGVAHALGDGPARAYSLDPEPLEQIADWLTPFLVLEANRSSGSASETVFSAWSGADVGETLGRTLAERTHPARAAIARRVRRKKPRNPS